MLAKSFRGNHQGIVLRSIGLVAALGLLASCGGKSPRSVSSPIEMPFTGTGHRESQPAPETRASLYLPSGDRRSSLLGVELVCPGEIHPGSPFDFRITATNLSASTTLRQVTVLQELPPYVTLSSTTPTANPLDRPASVAGSVVYGYELGELRPGETREITGRAVSPDSGSASFRLAASFDPALDWQAPVVEPKVTVLKQAPTEVLSCDPIPYTVTIRNQGSGVARRLTLTEVLPSGLTSNGTEQFEEFVGDLAPGEERVITFSAMGSRIGTYETFMMLRGNGIEVESNRVTTTLVQPSLAVTRSALAEIAPGEEGTYTITIENTGNAPASQVSLHEVFAVGLIFVSAEPAPEMVADGSRWALPDLAVGQSLPVIVTVRREGEEPAALGALTASAHCAEEVVIAAGQ